MRIKSSVVTVFITLLLCLLVASFETDKMKASGIIYNKIIFIKADGSIEPLDAPLFTMDNVTYTLTSNITTNLHGIVIERDGITLNGAGYTLQGDGGNGIDLTGRSKVTIKNITIEGFGDCIILAGSSNNSISGSNIRPNTIQNKWHHGINIISPSNYNTISGNTITNSYLGIIIWNQNSSSSHDHISGNNITNNNCGIWIYQSSNNIISRNNIAANTHSILLENSSNNKFYHNNFVNNGQIPNSTSEYMNVWDDGYPFGGNCWYGHVDIDDFQGPHQNISGSDGIWDHPYTIDDYNRDNYPLAYPVIPLTLVFTTYSHQIIIHSNSSITAFEFNTTMKQISFNISGLATTTGFCQVTFPDDLLWGEFSIFMDDSLLVKDVEYTQTYNGTHYTFYISYSHSTHTINIVGTEVIPEFPLQIFPLLLMIATLLAVIVYRRKHTTTS